jgi:hypothetical protein
MNSRFLHTAIRIRRELVGERPAGIGVGPDVVARIAEGESEEGSA